MPDSNPPTVRTCSIAMRFDAESAPRALELLLSACGPIRAKRGCTGCRVEQDASDPGVLHFREEWDSEPRFLSHFRSEEFWRVLVAMDLCSEEPQVVVGQLSAEYGMDVLRRLVAKEP